MEIFKLQGEIRENIGKKHVKEVRKSEAIPCVLYGGKDTVSFSVDPKDVKDLIYTDIFRIVELDIAGKVTRSILKDVQFHPVSDSVLHLDFQELKDGRNVKVSVPVGFFGSSPGVKEGGSLQSLMRRVVIKTTPDTLVDNLKADISKLGLGQSLRVKHLTIPEGIMVMHDENTPIAFVEIPRSLRSAKDAAAKTTS
jgi:large subunit ribosomal protein L25